MQRLCTLDYAVTSHIGTVNILYATCMLLLMRYDNVDLRGQLHLHWLL